MSFAQDGRGAPRLACAVGDASRHRPGDRARRGPRLEPFVLSSGVVYHTFSRHAPDGNLLSPYYYELLDQVPKGRGDEYRARRRDEYPDS